MISCPWLNGFLQSWELVAGAADLIDPSRQLVPVDYNIGRNNKHSAEIGGLYAHIAICEAGASPAILFRYRGKRFVCPTIAPYNGGTLTSGTTESSAADGTRELLQASLMVGSYARVVETQFREGRSVAHEFPGSYRRFCHRPRRGPGVFLKEYPILISPILEDRADVVFGSRFLGGRAHRVLYFWHIVGNRFLTLLSNMFKNLNLTDMETCYKVFRCELLDAITSRRTDSVFNLKLPRRSHGHARACMRWASPSTDGHTPRGKRLAGRTGSLPFMQS